MPSPLTAANIAYIVSEMRALRRPLTAEEAMAQLRACGFEGQEARDDAVRVLALIAQQEFAAAREARAKSREVAAEKAFIRKILKAVLALDPHYVLVVDDGQETFEVLANIARAINVIYTVEQATVFVRNGLTREKIGTLVFILGNAPDEVLADWGYSGSPEGMRLDAMLDNLIV